VVEEKEKHQMMTMVVVVVVAAEAEVEKDLSMTTHNEAKARDERQRKRKRDCIKFPQLGERNNKERQRNSTAVGNKIIRCKIWERKLVARCRNRIQSAG
jgi:hypothetical protein